MTKYQRTILFISFVLIFFIATPVVVLYTRGYRVNLTERTIVQTGGISLSPHPIGVTIFLDGKKKDVTSFLFRDAIFRNILPRTYNIRVEKEGYQSWEKFLVVEESKVAQIKNLRLFPQNPETALVVRGFSFINVAPNAQYALIVSKNPNTARNEMRLIKIAKDTVQETQLEITFDTISQVRWSTNSEIALIKSRSHGITNISTLSAKNPASITNWNKFLQNSYPRALERGAELYPTESEDELMIVQKNNLSARTLTRASWQKNITQNILRDIEAYSVGAQSIFYINTNGLLTKAALGGAPLNKLDDFIFNKKERVSAQILVRDDEKSIIVLHGGALYLWQEGSAMKQMTKGIPISGVAFAPDKEKIAYWNDNEIIIHWLKDIFGPPYRIAGGEEHINEFRNIRNVIWLDGEHIAAQMPQSLGFAELDARSRRNIATYEISASGDLFVLEQEKSTLLIESGANLIRIPLE